MDASVETAARVRALSPWFHNFDFDGVQTAPDHFLGDYPRTKWERFAHALPVDLRGRTVLDIGCNAGFYSIEMKRRGADRVLGIDVDPRYLEQARLAASLRSVQIELRRLSVYQLPRLGERFDIVLFMGVLYHLRYPLLALDLIRDHVARDIVVVQSMLRGSRAVVPTAPDSDFHDEDSFTAASYPAAYFIEHKYAADPTNWWIPNASALAAMLRSAGFVILERPEEEVFVCRAAPVSGAQREPAGLPSL
jgi:tRNA (mo5U34)-methyltransferase